MLLHEIPSHWIILPRNQKITSILQFYRVFPLGTFYFPFCFSWILLKFPICDPNHIAIRNITSGSLFKWGVPHTTISATCPHSLCTLTSRQALHDWPMAANVHLVMSEAPRGDPDLASWGTGSSTLKGCFHHDEDGRERELHTWCSNISLQPWGCHQEVKLPGGTRLWHFSIPRDQRKTNSFHKTWRKAGKMLYLPQLSSVHSFIHLEMLMQTHYKPAPGDAEMSK